MESPSGDRMYPRYSTHFRVKLTFVGTGKKPVLAKALEYFLDMLVMIHGIIGINEDVV